MGDDIFVLELSSTRDRYLAIHVENEIYFIELSPKTIAEDSYKFKVAPTAIATANAMLANRGATHPNIRTLRLDLGKEFALIRHELSQTQSLWLETGPVQHFACLEDDIDVDVAIIGGGITGLTAADLLKRAGKTVAVIDLGRIGHGESGHTTAHLTELLDIQYRELISNFGLEGGRLACQASRKAIQRIEANVLAYDIDCDFSRVSGWKFTESVDDIEDLEAESEAALQLSVPNTLTYETPLPFRVERAMRLDHQGRFHPLKYLNALAEQVSGDGSYVFENSRALDIQEGEPCKVMTERGVVTARDVIIAANVPILNRFFLITKIAAYRSYALAFKSKRSWDSDHLFWDTADPYHYIRRADINGDTYLIVGGEDHKTGQDAHTETHYQRLESWCRQRFDFDTIERRWSGQIIEPVDGLPYIGRNSMSDNIYVATAYSGTGMTFGTMAGMLLSDLILGQSNPWEALFDATRVKPLAGARSFLSENVDYPARLVSDRLSPAQATGLNQLRENEGALVRIGGKKVAAYRDPDGHTHLLSPVCPHLGCYVHWNEAEKSWDCPCHGSRFDPVGRLLNGPAVSDLKPETTDEDLPYVAERYEAPPERGEPIGPPLLSFFQCPLKPEPGS